MATWLVTLPITGKLSVEVEAETKKEALDKAFDEVSIDDIDEWEAHEVIVEGNVFHGNFNYAEVERLDGEDTEDEDDE